MKQRSLQITLYKEKIYIETCETGFKHEFNNHTKSWNLKQYENDTAIQKILHNKMQPFHIKSHLESTQPKENITCISMKS